VLEIAETPKENPNYFFAGYQATGDKYNVPNPSPDLHVRSWRAVAPFLDEYGMRVWNCSPISRVDAFPFRDLDEIERERITRNERPRALRVDRILATSSGRCRSVGEFEHQQRSLFGRAIEFGEWCIRELWRRRRGLGGLATLAVLLPLMLAFILPSWLIQWLLISISGLLALATLAGLVLLRVVESLDARAAAYAREAQLNAEATAHRRLLQFLENAETKEREPISPDLSESGSNSEIESS